MTRLTVGIAVLASALVSAQQPFRGRVDVVSLNISVLSGNKPVVDLKATDFLVTDNGVRQNVSSVSRETVPIDLTIAIDTSQNMHGHGSARAIEKAVDRVNRYLQPTDRVSVWTFDSDVHEVVPMGPPPIRPVNADPARTPSALNDALGRVVAPRAGVDRRRMGLIFTDGFNSAGGLTEEDVLDLASRSDITVFTVTRVWRAGIPELMAVTQGQQQRLEFFDQLATMTGGFAQFVSPGQHWVAPNGSSSGSQVNENLLDDAFIRALEEFRSGYVLRYNPTPPPDAGWHDVRVSVTRPNNKYVVRTRRGYRAG